jgi:cyclohexyl-isocyanide hydratase
MNKTQSRLEIGMLLYPGLTLLDLIGPATVFSWYSNIHLVWKTMDLVRSDTGVGIQPTATFSTCPSDLDVLFAPGGFGQQTLMGDAAVLSFLADRGSRAKYVTSVCTGSLLLGAAGLLNGYKATSHWAMREGLAVFGAIPTEARVVVDRNRVTGGGVTAGIDFGLVLLAKLRGEDAAKLTQLAMEYDPEPPFQAGTPKTAGPRIVEQTMSLMAAELEKLAH